MKFPIQSQSYLPVGQWSEISLSALSPGSELALSVATRRVLTCRGKEMIR